MKRLLTTVSLFALATSSAFAADAVTPATHSSSSAVHRTKTQAKAIDYNAHPELMHHGGAVAPADEYFGKLKMSILGIRNEIKDMTTKVGFAPDNATSQLGACAMTEDAIHDWEKKYPADSWIPKTLLELQRLYGSSNVPEFQAHMKATYAWLTTRYKSSKYAVTARQEYNAKLAALANPTPPPAAAAPPAPIDISNPGASTSQAATSSTANTTH